MALPFPILSDVDGRFAAALRLPSFTAGGEIYLKRLTLLIDEGRIDRVFYPVARPGGPRGRGLAEAYGSDLKRLVLGVLDRIAEPVEPFLEIVGKQRHAEQIVLGAVGALGARGGQRFLELVWRKRAPADPGESDQARLLVDIEVANEFLELLLGRVVGEGFEDRLGVVIGAWRPRPKPRPWPRFRAP